MVLRRVHVGLCLQELNRGTPDIGQDAGDAEPVASENHRPDLVCLVQESVTAVQRRYDGNGRDLLRSRFQLSLHTIHYT